MVLARIRLAAGATFAALTLSLSPPVLAAGGAHVVDDAGVETPGRCHVESWLSRAAGHESLANVGPACTPAALPSLELGAAVQRVEGSGTRQWLVGPTIKWAMLPGGGEGEPPGMALAFALLADPGAGRMESLAFSAPITAALGPRLVANLNLGAVVQRGSRAKSLQGAQLVYAAGSGLSLMAELYSTGSEAPGGQAGLRWTIDQGRIDLDLLVGRPAGSDGCRTVTLGFTVRR